MLAGRSRGGNQNPNQNQSLSHISKEDRNHPVQWENTVGECIRVRKEYPPLITCLVWRTLSISISASVSVSESVATIAIATTSSYNVTLFTVKF